MRIILFVYKFVYFIFVGIVYDTFTHCKIVQDRVRTEARQSDVNVCYRVAFFQNK